MNNMHEQQIMAVDRDLLFAAGHFQGFSPAEDVNYEKIIQGNYFFDQRSKLENSPQHKQPICYGIIVHPEAGKIFVYQRGGSGNYSESRLQGKISWGIGGHIEKIDVDAEGNIRDSLMREINEEIYLPESEPPVLLGYINDDQNGVGSVHFGLLFLINLRGGNVEPRNSEISWGALLHFSELGQIISAGKVSVESWSMQCLEPVKRTLGWQQTC